MVQRAREHTEALLGVRERLVAELAAVRAQLERIPGRRDDYERELPVWTGPDDPEPPLSSTGG